MSFWAATTVLLWLMTVCTLLLLARPGGATIEPTWSAIATALAPPRHLRALLESPEVRSLSQVAERPLQTCRSADAQDLEPVPGEGAARREARLLPRRGRPAVPSDLRRRMPRPLPLSGLVSGARLGVPTRIPSCTVPKASPPQVGAASVYAVVQDVMRVAGISAQDTVTKRSSQIELSVRCIVGSGRGPTARPETRAESPTGTATAQRGQRDGNRPPGTGVRGDAVV